MNVIYRPPHGNFSLFLREIESLILESEINEADVINMGDFNIWVHDFGNSDAQNFLRLLNNFSLVNLVNKHTYNSGHTLDLVITTKFDFFKAFLTNFDSLITYSYLTTECGKILSLSGHSFTYYYVKDNCYEGSLNKVKS